MFNNFKWFFNYKKFFIPLGITKYNKKEAVIFSSSIIKYKAYKLNSLIIAIIYRNALYCFLILYNLVSIYAFKKEGII
jgi:hypothetical protein